MRECPGGRQRLHWPAPEGRSGTTHRAPRPPAVEQTPQRGARATAAAVGRKKHGLLSADEIRALRERFGLTQSELARLLHVGANTISRWESGRNVQTDAMEMLLRLLRDLPGSLDYLGQHAA